MFLIIIIVQVVVAIMAVVNAALFGDGILSLRCYLGDASNPFRLPMLQ